MKQNKRILFFAATLLSLLASSYTMTTFKLGAVSLKDRRFIYPAIGQSLIPVGDSLEQHNGAITVEPRLDFMRNHDEKCGFPTRGHFDNHDEIFWFCADKTSDTKPGEVRVANPAIPGKRTKVVFKTLPGKDKFLLICPLFERGKAVVIAKGAENGKYDIYTEKGKLDKPLITNTKKVDDSAKLKVIMAPKSSGKSNELYFYFDNEVGKVNIFHYKLDTKTFTEIDMKKVDEPLS